jgi:enoyl-CoA hydratase
VVKPEELMPTCYALAKDITSCVPATVQTAKRLIESGFAMSLGDGMQLEQEINHNHRGATAEEIAARRDAVQSRGRSQSS